MASAFLRVVNLSVSAGYIILAVMVLRLILRRAPKWMSCALWALVALRLVCPFSLESALSLLPSGEAVGPAVLEIEAAAPETVFIHTGFEAVDRPANAALHAAAEQARPQEKAEPQAAATATAPARRASALPTLLGAASVVWLVGAAAMVLYGAGSYLRLRRRVRTAVLWKEDLWQCETVDAPFVLGVVKPRVYLPFYMDPVAAAQVIAHERAHIRRHDQLTKVFAWLLLSAYWFDPLVWAAYALLCRDIELACDERVVRDMSTQARQRYARALLNWGVDKPNLAACPLAFGEVGLKERIKTVMKYKKPARWAALLAVALIAASGVCLLTSPMAEAVAPAAESAPFRGNAENEQTPAPDESQAPATPTAEPSLDPDAVPDPVPILTVRPRDLTADEAKTIVTAIFGDAPVYKDIGRTKQELAAAIERAEQVLAEVEASGDQWYIGEAAAALEDLRMQYDAAPETLERELCDWTFRPQEGDILARSSLDGGDYVIEVMDPGPQGTPGADCLMIYKLDDGPVPAQTTAPTGAQIDAMTGQVSGWLDKMGLENYAVAAAEVTDDTGAVVIFAQPSYNGVVQLPFDWQHDPFADQTLWFSFLGGELDTCIYSSPLEVIASQQQETLMSLRDALAAAGWEDSLTALDWRFCYSRVPDADGSGNYHLVPSYRYGPVSGETGSGVVIVSAVDGSVIAGTRPTGSQPPQDGADVQPSSTPIPPVAELEVRWGKEGLIDYVESGWLSLLSGQSIDLYAIWYPQAVSATPEWTVDDESVVSIQPNDTGIQCRCELVGASGAETVLHVKVNEKQQDIRIIVA